MRVLGLLKVPGKGIDYGLVFCIVVCVRKITFLRQSYFGYLIQNNCLIFHLSCTSNESYIKPCFGLIFISFSIFTRFVSLFLLKLYLYFSLELVNY